MRTFSPKAGDIQHQWHVIDASDVVLGRLASHVAILLRGKHKPIFAPHMDTGDFVIVVNAEKVALSGNKLQRQASLQALGLPRAASAPSPTPSCSPSIPNERWRRRSRACCRRTRLGRSMLRKLKVYAGPDHPHQAQQPTPFTITQIAQPAGTPSAGAK